MAGQQRSLAAVSGTATQKEYLLHRLRVNNAQKWRLFIRMSTHHSCRIHHINRNWTGFKTYLNY